MSILNNLIFATERPICHKFSVWIQEKTQMGFIYLGSNFIVLSVSKCKIKHFKLIFTQLVSGYHKVFKMVFIYVIKSVLSFSSYYNISLL